MGDHCNGSPDHLQTTTLDKMDDSIVGIDKRNSSSLDYRKINGYLPTRASCPPGTGGYDADNHAQTRFMMSFMVDARGRVMHCFRYDGFRISIPAGRVCAPTRISCRMLKKEKFGHRLPIMENEALACRILEMGTAGTEFSGLVLLEVPHIANMRSKDRELVVLRSDDGRSWKEHRVEKNADDLKAFGDLESEEDLAKKNVMRILTTSFPRFFAIITRLRVDVQLLGDQGGLLVSKVDNRVQAVIPPGALTKDIKVGIQTQLIDEKQVKKCFGDKINAISPIISVERRRRMFHQPICLKIPIPKLREKGVITKYSPNLRLLCSINGGFEDSEWQDTEAKLESFLDGCVCFTTSLSARYWLIDLNEPNDVESVANELYSNMPKAPLITKFVVSAGNLDKHSNTSRVCVSCGTGDHPHLCMGALFPYTEVAKSRNVEVHENQEFEIKVDGNIATIGAAPTSLRFDPFHENRYQFNVKVTEVDSDPSGRICVRPLDECNVISTLEFKLPIKQDERKEPEINITEVS